MTTQQPPQNPAMMAAPAQVAAAMPANPNAGNHPSGSLYVGDLDTNVSEAELFEIFNHVGPVSSIRVCRDSSTRRSLGYAYVNFHNADDAERALDTLNFEPIKGRPCRIMWSHRDPSIRKSSSANVFIKNLDKTIGHKELYDTFSQFGNILSCKVATDLNGASQGYGFVHYAEEDQATKAIDEVNGKMIKDKKVYVAKHERRADRESSGAGGSRYTNVYVKNVPEDWTQEKFEEVFKGFGTITSAVLKVDEAGKSKGFGFVNYENHEDAVKSIEEGSKIPAGEDKTLFVDRFQKKSERQVFLKKKHEDARREKSEKYKNLNLYVKNLEEDVDEDKLKELFEPFGEITSIVVMKDEKNVSRGFGFVCYVSADDATKALNDMNGKMIGTKPIYVNRAQRKEERRVQLETQFQPMPNPRGMPMHPFYPAPNMGMGQMVFPPHMPRPGAGGNRYAGMRPQYPPYQGQPRPGRGAQGNRPMHGGGMRQGGGQQKVRHAGPRYQGGRDMMGGHMPVPQVQAPVAAPGLMSGGELTTTALADAQPEMQKQMLGERLFPLVVNEQPEKAGKITGMLLEMEVSEILGLLENQQDLKGKIAEALEVLESHKTDA